MSFFLNSLNLRKYTFEEIITIKKHITVKKNYTILRRISTDECDRPSEIYSIESKK